MNVFRRYRGLGLRWTVEGAACRGRREPSRGRGKRDGGGEAVKREEKRNPLDSASTSPGLFRTTRGVVKNSPGLVEAESKGFWEYRSGSGTKGR